MSTQLLLTFNIRGAWGIQQQLGLAAADWSAGGIVTMVAAIIGMIAIAFVAWKVVQRQERRDAAFEEKLRADDQRAARGLRQESGLPPEGGANG